MKSVVKHLFTSSAHSFNISRRLREIAHAYAPIVHRIGLIVLSFLSLSLNRETYTFLRIHFYVYIFYSSELDHVEEAIGTRLGPTGVRIGIARMPWRNTEPSASVICAFKYRQRTSDLVRAGPGDAATRISESI